MKSPRHILPAVALAALATTASANIGFENVSFASGLNFENGENLFGTTTVTNQPFGSPGSLVTKESSVAFSNSGMTGLFDNVFNEKFDQEDGAGNSEFTYWSGWAFSKATDIFTSGSGNQYSAVAGSGARGSDNYGVSFGNTQIDFFGTEDFTGRGFDVTNTTFAHNSMRDGDSFAKQFEADDFFYLTVEGFLSGASVGALDFYLADFRSPDPSEHTILNDWAFVNLSSFGEVDSLAFDLTSSDNGTFGMNTPDYFAIDNIGVVPEPAAYALFAGLLGMSLVALRRRGPSQQR